MGRVISCKDCGRRHSDTLACAGVDAFHVDPSLARQVTADEQEKAHAARVRRYLSDRRERP